MYQSQRNEVLLYLEKHYTIDDKKAVFELGIHDLQHAIYELRKEGYKVLDKWIHTVNRHGKKVKYKEYRLEKENGDMERY